MRKNWPPVIHMDIMLSELNPFIPGQMQFSHEWLTYVLIIHLQFWPNLHLELQASEYTLHTFKRRTNLPNKTILCYQLYLNWCALSFFHNFVIETVQCNVKRADATIDVEHLDDMIVSRYEMVTINSKFSGQCILKLYRF